MFVFSAGLAYADDIALEHRKDNAKADANEIIDMRSTLAKEFIKPGVEVNEDTFKKVCGQVAKRVKEITDKEGFLIRHASLKNRNPMNAATQEEAALIGNFEEHKEMTESSGKVEKDGKTYYRYTKPIFVEEACLACHGAKEARPKFIVEKYPDDKAYGYRAGDLRGIVSILVPAE